MEPTGKLASTSKDLPRIDNASGAQHPAVDRSAAPSAVVVAEDSIGVGAPLRVEELSSRVAETTRRHSSYDRYLAACALARSQECIQLEAMVLYFGLAESDVVDDALALAASLAAARIRSSSSDSDEITKLFSLLNSSELATERLTALFVLSSHPILLAQELPESVFDGLDSRSVPEVAMLLQRYTTRPLTSATAISSVVDMARKTADVRVREAALYALAHRETKDVLNELADGEDEHLARIAVEALAECQSCL